MIRIAITGSESTGKSWLAEQLAKHYKTEWVPEYAREYLEKLGHLYEYDDILAIASGQLEAEEKAALIADRMLLCDTDFIVTKIWCNVKYNRCHPWILEMAETHRYDLYLLCNIDLPWQFDPLREHPAMRNTLFDMYQQELKSNNFNFRIISGSGNDRLNCAVKEVDNFLINKKQ